MLPTTTENGRRRCGAVLLTLWQPLAALAQQGPQPPWDWPGPWQMWSGGFAFWWICPLVFLLMVALCAGVFFLMRRSGGGSGLHRWPWQAMGPVSADPTQSALRLLNERFAKGDIQKPEYEEKKAAILARGTS